MNAVPSKNSTITRSGTNSSQTPERKMLYEVFALLLTFEGPRKLTLDLVEVVGCRKKTKLDIGKLNSKMEDVVECSAMCLFNGACLIWSEHITITAGIDGDKGEDNAEHEFRIQERAIHSIVVSEASVPDHKVDDDSTPSHFGTSKGKVPN